MRGTVANATLNRIQQQDLTDCGPAALAALIYLLTGRRFSVREIGVYSSMNESGSTFVGLRTAARNFGCDLTLYRLHESSSLQAVPRRYALVQIQKEYGYHYVVIIAWGKAAVSYFDPSSGHVEKVSLADFMNLWVKKVLLTSNETSSLFEKSEPQYKVRFIENNPASLPAIIFHMRRRARLLLVLMPFLGIMSYGFGAAFSYIYAWYYDFVLPEYPPRNLFLFAFFFSMLVILKFICDLLLNAIRSYVVTEIDSILMQKVTRKLLGMNLRGASSFSEGDLVSRLAVISQISANVVTILALLPVVISALIISFVIFAFSSPILAIWSLVPLLAMIVVSFLFSRRYRLLSEKVYSASEGVNVLLLDMLDNLPVIKRMNAVIAWRIKVSENIQALISHLRHLNFSEDLDSKLKSLFLSSYTLILFIKGVELVHVGSVSQGMLLTLNALAISVFMPSIEIFDLQREFKQGRVACLKIEDLLLFRNGGDFKKELPERLGSLVSRKSTYDEPALELDSVGFGYDYRRVLLEQVSLVVNRGTKVAIVGESGSGKSTLARLLAGYIDPLSGSVSHFGRNISTLSEAEICSNVIYVPAETTVFSGTVMENICLTDDWDLDNVLSMIRGIGFDEVVERFPDALRQHVSSKGSVFSTGELRLLGLCRALLSRAPVWILDEVASGLDRSRQQEVYDFLLGRPETIVFVTHDLEFAARCDAVLGVREGRIISLESPKELFSFLV